MTLVCEKRRRIGKFCNDIFKVYNAPTSLKRVRHAHVVQSQTKDVAGSATKLLLQIETSSRSHWSRFQRKQRRVAIEPTLLRLTRVRWRARR